MKLEIRERSVVVLLFSLMLAGILIESHNRSVNATSKQTSAIAVLPASLQRHIANSTDAASKWKNIQASTAVVEPTAAFMGCATPSFAPAPTSPESTGLDPHYVCTGYFNADSHLDIAVTNEDSDNLSILLGDGTGNFTEAPGPRAPTGFDPITVEDGDFNGDGKADLAVANQGSSNVNIFLGNGDGTFTEAPGSPITVGALPRAVAVGHFNGDAHQDLVVSNGGISNDVSILLGNGDGTFTNAPGSPFFTGGAPFHAVIGNFNGDAYSDLAIALFGDGTVRIYLGNGNGTFTQSGAAISVGTFTSFIALGDYNEDTHQDLAVVSRLSNNMVILLGNGSGGFSQAPGSPYSTGTAPMAVATADLNFDGHLDLAVSNENSANTFVYLGNGNGTFGSPTSLLKGQLPTHVAIADFNNDNRPDIATSDGGDHTVTILLNTCTACFPITVNPATIASATAGSNYSQSFSATSNGGTGPYSFNLTGTLPNGLIFSGNTLSGTPTQTGNFPITVTATDINTSCTGSRNYTLVVNCQSIAVNPASIPNGAVGASYSQTFTHEGGIGSTTFNLTGTLPTGLGFSGATLSGTPTQSGSFPITVTATDSNNCTGSRNYTLVINACPAITVNPATIPAGTVNAAYSQTFTQTGGVGSVNFSLTGTLPNGMSFSGATLSGMPTQTGSFPITLTATDSNFCTGSRNYTLVINCQTYSVTPSSIPAGTAGTAYNHTFAHNGGIGDVTFAQNGKLPSGITFSGATLSGTPTQTGSFPISITATDANGCTATRNYTLIINCQAITVNPATIPPGTVNVGYMQTFTQTGGIGATSFSLSGTLPTGVTFSGATLSGVPTQSGNFPITVTATDSNNCTGSRNYTLVINCQVISIQPVTIPSGTVGAVYGVTFTANGAVGAVAFSLNGKLPPGMGFSGATLSGTPTQAGTYPISITAVDENNCSTTRNYTLVINCQTITVNPTTIPAATAGVAYSQNFTQVGGVGSVNFSVSGSLPNGLSFSGSTLSGTPTQSGNFTFTVTATDANNCFGSRTYTLAVSLTCGTIVINPATLPNGFVGVLYSQSLTGTGGFGTYTFALDSGTLPPGVNLSGANLTGTPTSVGAFNFVLRATDGLGCTGTRAYTVSIFSGNNGLQFYPLAAPVRLLDTRAGETGCFTPGVKIPGGTSRTQQAANTCGIPTNAKAVTGNITTVQSGGGYLTIYPSDAAQPTVANSNFAPNEILNNVFTVGLGADGAFKIFVTSNTDVVVDITGYYAPPATGGLYFHPLPKPIRLLETRAGEPGCFAPGAPITGNTEFTQQGTGTCSGVTIPASALALVGNATTVNPVGGGFLTFFPANATRPLIASGNYDAGEILNSPFTAGLSPTGQFKIYTLATTHLVVDVLGYFSPDAVDVNGAGLLFNPITPVRLLETRAGEPGCTTPGAPLAAGVETPQTAQNFCSIAATAKAIVGNATVVQPGSGGFLTFWPSDATRPLVATSNYLSGDILNRHFTVGLGANGQFKIFPSSTTHLVVDVSGYFAP
jgi:hypothetical protein